MSDGRGKARKADKKLPEGICAEDVPEYVSYSDEKRDKYWVMTNHPWQICVEYKKYILSDGRSRITIKSVTNTEYTPRAKLDDMMIKYRLCEEKYKEKFGEIPPEIIVKIIREARVTNDVEKAERNFVELFNKIIKRVDDEDEIIDDSPAHEISKEDEDEIIDESIPIPVSIHPVANAGAGKEIPETFNNDIAPPYDKNYKLPKQWKDSVIKTHYLKGILYYYKQFCIEKNKKAGIYSDGTKWNAKWNEFISELDTSKNSDDLNKIIETFSKNLKEVRNGRKKE